MAIEGLGSIFSGAFKGAGGKVVSTLVSFLWGVAIFIVVGVIVYMIYRSYKNKAVYTYPITLITIMENGMEKVRTDLKGGVFTNKGIKDFKIKAPKKNKKHILGYIPDFSKSNSIDGRLKFITSGDGTAWQQYEEKWVLKENVTSENGNIYSRDLIKVPIPRETKQIAINSIKSWRDTVEKSKLTAFGIAIGAFVIMVIAHLISLYIQTRIKCGTP